MVELESYMGSERDQTDLLASEISSSIKALSNSIFSRRNIRREEIKSSLLHIAKCECSGGCGLHWKASWGWWFLWPCMMSTSPLLPATPSCLLFWRIIWALFSGDTESWCFKQPLQPCSLLPSFPAVTHPRNLLSPSCHVLCHIRQLLAPRHQSNASAFPCPCTTVSSVPEDSGTRITLKWSLVQNQKQGLQRSASMGTTPGNRRLGAASRRGTKVTARDRGEEDRFSARWLPGACSSCRLGFGLLILTNILTVQHPAHCSPLS